MFIFGESYAGAAECLRFRAGPTCSRNLRPDLDIVNMAVDGFGMGTGVSALSKRYRSI